MVGNIKKIVAMLAKLHQNDPFRIRLTDQLLQKLCEHHAYSYCVLSVSPLCSLTEFQCPLFAHELLLALRCSSLSALIQIMQVQHGPHQCQEQPVDVREDQRV